MVTGQFCCEMMKEDLTYQCRDHRLRDQCPDNLIRPARDSQDDWGIYIHDGSTSFMVISYCPWCGKGLQPNPKLAEVIQLLGNT